MQSPTRRRRKQPRPQIAGVGRAPIALSLWFWGLFLLTLVLVATTYADTGTDIAEAVHHVAPILPPPFDGLLTLFAAIASAVLSVFARRTHNRVKRLENGKTPTPTEKKP
jgi:hypothetical protein